MVLFKALCNGIIDVLYPRICLACRKRRAEETYAWYLCGPCARSIEFSIPPFCACCGRQLQKPHVYTARCGTCAREQRHFDRAFSPCVYNGVLKELIHSFKYRGNDYLGAFLSGFMVAFIRAYSLPVEDMDYIIPVPLHPARLREREFNQAEILATQVACAYAATCATNLLIRQRQTKTQTLLAPEDRKNNVHNSFIAAPGAELRDKRILLIDDVLTTGATASEAAAALKHAGASMVFVLTLAH
jgi:competence protein ComFC